ncbi:hypothetical protein SLA2020_161520 [Shorea laevis]
MKGILKGLKYFIQMFEFDEKEPEMKIGLPTDVRHVAHIGHDGASANTPSWMNEFNSNQEPSAGAAGVTQNRNASEKPKHKSRRKSSTGSGSPFGSPKPEKHSRRRSSNISMDSPSRDPTSDLNRRKGSSNLSFESPMHDASMPPKHSRQKKSSKGSSGGGSSKGSSGCGSSKPSRSKGQNSLPDVLEIES